MSHTDFFLHILSVAIGMGVYYTFRSILDWAINHKEDL